MVATLLSTAKKSLAAGSLEDARRASELALRLAPENADARDALARASAPAPTPEPTPAPPYAPVFTKKNLKGLDSKSGAFVVKDGRITGDSGGVPAFLLLSKRPPREFDLRAVVEAGGAGAGLVAGRSKGKGLAFVVAPGGVALRDLATGADLAKGGNPPGGGVLTIELKVIGPLARGFVNGSLAAEALLDAPPSGDAGFVRIGSATLHELGLRPSFAADCLDSALAALASPSSERARDEALAAAAALEREGAGAEADLVRAAALASRSRLEDARAARERGRASRLASRAADARVKKIEALADKALHEAAPRRAAIDAPFLAVAAELREDVLRAIADNRGADALRVATRLETLLPGDRSTRLLRLRAYGHARGTNGVIPLFDGTLDGWTVRKGTFVPLAAEKGVLAAPSEFAPHEAVRSDIEGYPRALLETEFRASSVYEAGLLVGGAENGYRFTLRNVLAEHEFLVRREDGEVKMRRELGDLVPKGDGTWHKLSLFVNRNRVAVFIDGKKALEKVFSRPLAGSPGLYVAESTAADFRNVTYRIFDDDRETERFLYDNDLGGEVLLEAEEVAVTKLASSGSVTTATQPLAFNGETLVLGDGRSAETYAEYVFDTPDWKPARLHVRYQRPDGGAAGESILVSVDGADAPVAIALPPTGEREFGTVAADLGALAAGEHRLRVVPKDPARTPHLDRLTVVGDAREPVEASVVLSSPRHPLLVIQTSPGVKLPEDVDPVFDMVDDVRGFMSEYLGVSLERALTLNVVSRECWGDPHLGGYATGRELYVPEETVFRDLATVAHELSHCFDSGQGFIPPWFGEGKSVPVFIDFMAERGEKYKWNALGGIDARARMGRGSRKAFETKEPGGSLLQYWGTDRFSYGEHALRGAAYDASAFLCADLRERYGRSFLKDFHALVAKDLAAGTYYLPAADRVLANSVLVDYLSRAAKEDLRPYFAEWGFEIRDLAVAGETMTAGSALEDPYLTRPGSSRFSMGGDAEGAAPGRILETGEMVFTFPLPSGTTEVELSVRARGRGRVTPDGGEPIVCATSSASDAEREEKRVVRERTSFTDGRFHVIVAAEPGGITVTRLAVRPIVR